MHPSCFLKVIKADPSWKALNIRLVIAKPYGFLVAVTELHKLFWDLVLIGKALSLYLVISVPLWEHAEEAGRLLAEVTLYTLYLCED